MHAVSDSETRWSPIRRPLTVSPQLVHVVRIRLDLPSDVWNSMIGVLTDDERERAARFRFDEPRRRFTICRATLRRLLGDCCCMTPESVALICGSHGKPELAFAEMDSNTPRIEFNASHSGDFGLIALTIGSPVGVDVEEFNSRIKTHGLAKRYFAPSEVDELFGLPAQDQIAGFYRGWTSKEAYIKATGLGLSLSLSSFAVTINPLQPASLRHVDDKPDESRRWTVQSLNVADGYAAAVMVATPDCRVECWDWTID